MDTNPYDRPEPTSPANANADQTSDVSGGQEPGNVRLATRLSLFDSTCLIVGIVVGSGIYETPALVAKAVDYPWEIFLLWILGGAISLCGAMCYAELATTYPESGGDVVYLNRAYGEWAGFLFGWLQTFVARPGDISLMALVFAHYVDVLVDPAAEGDPPIWPAIVIVALLTVVNIAGLRFGKSTQNLLSVVKITGLFAIIGLAFAASGERGVVDVSVTPDGQRPTWGVALILILFTYGGWNEMVYVASEVQQPRRNLWRALVFGTLAVTSMYLLANAAYLASLTLPGMANSGAIATDAVKPVLPRAGQMLVAAVISISAAGAINGLVLTGSRITGAMQKYPAFRWLGHWDVRLHTPVRALVLEGLIAITVISIARTFENALIYTSAAVYTFYLATSFTTVILRQIDPHVERPFRMPLYPLPLLIFAGGCTCTIWSAFNYDPVAAKVCMTVISIGGVVYLLQHRFLRANSA